MTSPNDPLMVALRAALEPAYDIESELSGGGMSRVFVATERALNRRVVVKVLPPDLAAGVNRERFRREIQLAAQLQHPHIVPLLSAGDTEGLLYYTMPFIEGESLKHALASGQRFSSREVLGILIDLVDALAYAHARGVIHRDVKPANVLRTGVHALVADFGVAKAISASLPAVGMTTSGMAIGTPQYMAPEQLAGDPAADHRVDIYALGLLGYELLTGAPTFAEPSPQATMAAQLTRSPEPIERKRPDVPNALGRLLMKCLAKDPKDRPPNAQAVRAELEAIVLPSGDYTPAPGIIRRRPIYVVPVALGALALVAVIALATQMGRRAAPEADSTATQPPPPPAAASIDSPAPAAPIPPPTTAVAPPPAPKGDSLGGRRLATASDSPRAGGTGARRSVSGSARARTALDSLADLALLLKAQAPGDPIIRPPSPNSVSNAAIAERRENPGPPRKALLVAGTDSLSRAILNRLARQLDASRFLVTMSETPAEPNSPASFDSLAAPGGHDIVIHAQAPMRRDSSFSGLIRLRDVTAHPNYANNASSRRIPRDSAQAAMDTLAANAIGRLVSMDRAPRAGVIDPEVRAFEERARNLGPPRRVVIWNHAPHDNLRVQEAGSMVMDVLRAAVRGLPRFVQVPRDSTLDLLARSRNRETVLSTLNADLMVSIASSSNSANADSVSWVITVRDAGAARQFEERSFRSALAPLSNPTAYVAVTLSRVLAALEQMDAAPRKPNAPSRNH